MRIMIFGLPGSGKTTFSFKLSRKVNLPLYHLDRYFYLANWQERNYDEFLRMQRELVAKDKWIIDGNCSKSFHIRYQRADIAIYFCYPRFLALLRIIKRKFFSKKDNHIDDRAEGCDETIQWSLIKYLWHYKSRFKEKIKQLQSAYPKVQLYVVHNDKGLEKLMNILTQK